MKVKKNQVKSRRSETRGDEEGHKCCWKEDYQ